jgi:hypothetical protein
MGFCMGFFCVSQNGQRGNAAEKLHKTAKTAQIISIQAVFVGAAGQIRTADLVITNDALYRLSYSSKSLSQERSVIIA